MTRFDTKVQMMDAGMTLFESEQNYGNTLGQLKAELEVYGNVLRPAEIAEAVLPESTGDCDLFLDWSTFWRVRYISCRLESAGETEKDGKTIYRYAATFKEGNRSSMFRGVVMLLVLLSFVVDAVAAHGFISTVLGMVLAALAAYLWILPSRKARRAVSELLAKLGA